MKLDNLYSDARLILNNHLRSFLSRLLPGKLWISSMEVPAVQHCNLRCTACDHAAPLLPESFVSPHLLKDDLEILSQHLRAGEFRIVGGEPLLHPDLGGLIEVVRRSNISSRITLVTNGVLIHTLDPVLWKSLDRLWVSLYPGIRTGMSLPEISRLCKEYGVKFSPVVTKHFKQTLLYEYNEDDDLVRKIFRKCDHAQKWRCYTIAEGYFFRCAVAPKTGTRLAMADQTYPGYEVDGLNIQDRTKLRKRLKGYAFSNRPMRACRYCMGSQGDTISHSQLD